jgi:hypothetical protein
MSKQVSETPLRSKEQLVASITAHVQALRKKRPSNFWLLLGGLLVGGLILVVVVTYAVWGWLYGVQSGIHVDQPSSSAAITMNVQRSATYADIDFTLTNVQYAQQFSNDSLHNSPATIRATIQVKNPTRNAIDLAYYDIVRLLVPKQQPIVPINLALPAVSKPGSLQTGWIDFPVAKDTALKTLQLQLGNAASNETLVTIPVSGAHDAHQFDNHLSQTSVTYNYYYGPYGNKYLLVYHLNSVDVRYAYNGNEAKAGQQFYVLNFTVDNPNGVWVGPGYAYDYIRLVFNGNLPPSDSTLPNGFGSNAQSVSGNAVYEASAGLNHLTIAFLAQFYQGQDVIDVDL